MTTGRADAAEATSARRDDLARLEAQSRQIEAMIQEEAHGRHGPGSSHPCAADGVDEGGERYARDNDHAAADRAASFSCAISIARLWVAWSTKGSRPPSSSSRLRDGSRPGFAWPAPAFGDGPIAFVSVTNYFGAARASLALLGLGK